MPEQPALETADRSAPRGASAASRAGGAFALQPRVALALVAITAFCIRTLHVFSYESIPSNDMAAFVTIATEKLTLANLFEPEGFSRYAPGYPLFLKPFYLALAPDGAARAVQIFQALLGAWTCVLIYRLARRLHSRRAGLAAALLTCFFPHFLFFTSHWMTENLFIPAFYASLLLFLRVAEKPTGAALYGAGAALGAAILVRPPAICLAPAAIFAAWKTSPDARGRLRAAALIAAGTATLILPWGLHMKIATGRTFSIAPYGAYLLSIGNAPEATGTTREIASPEGDYWKQMDAYRGDALGFVTGDPWGALYVTMRLKWKHFWSFNSPWPISALNPMGMWGGFFFPYASWRIVFITGLVGVLLARRKGPQGVVFLVLACYVVFYMVLYGKPRYRMPIEGIFLAWAGVAAAGIAEGFARTRRLKATAWGAAVAATLGLVLLETGVDAAVARNDRTRDDLVLASRDRLPLVAAQPPFPLLGEEPIQLDRSRGRYLKLELEVHRSGPKRTTPANGWIDFEFSDASESPITWIDKPRYVLEALPDDRWVPVRLKAQIPPAATSLRILVTPDRSSPDVFLIDNVVLRYARGNDLALEFLAPYLQRLE